MQNCIAAQPRGGIALPSDPNERPAFARAILSEYTEAQIEGDPVLAYLLAEYIGHVGA